MPEPDWLLKVRDANRAIFDAAHAIDEAFPQDSRWTHQGSEVVVSSLGADIQQLGNVWVRLVAPPGWSKSVSCSSLEPVPNGVEPCPTIPNPTAPEPPSSASPAGNTSGS